MVLASEVLRLASHCGRMMAWNFGSCLALAWVKRSFGAEGKSVPNQFLFGNRRITHVWDQLMARSQHTQLELTSYFSASPEVRCLWGFGYKIKMPRLGPKPKAMLLFTPLWYWVNHLETLSQIDSVTKYFHQGTAFGFQTCALGFKQPRHQTTATRTKSSQSGLPFMYCPVPMLQNFNVPTGIRVSNMARRSFAARSSLLDPFQAFPLICFDS